MTQLPLEVLKRIFRLINKRDLLQCQITCKQWYEASVEFLYSDVTLATNEISRQYTHTISNSTRLSSYLKTINVLKLFEPEKNKYWDEYGLLNILIKQCFNLTKIVAENLDHAFWIKISTASTQGQLSRLQYLPKPNSSSLESYIYTALYFKDSLLQLSLFDDKFCYGLDLAPLNIHKLLFDQTNQFKKLHTIVFKYKSNKMLSDFDSVIGNCPNLQVISIVLRNEKKSETITSTTSISPLPNVKHLFCNWDIVNDDNQLKYILHRFPNLRTIVVRYETFGHKRQAELLCSYNTIVEFLQHAIKLPNFDVKLDVKTQDLMSIWTELLEKRNSFKDLLIFYRLNVRTNGYRKHPIVRIYPEHIDIEFPYENNNIDELPHIRFLSETGSKIRSLNLRYMVPTNFQLSPASHSYKHLLSTEGIFECLRLCPSLRVLTFYGARKLADDLNLPKVLFPEVKKLSIFQHKSGAPFDYLEQLCGYLPGLREIKVQYEGSAERNEPEIVVNIPDLSFRRFILEYVISPEFYGQFVPFLVNFKNGLDESWFKIIVKNNTMIEIGSEEYSNPSFKCRRLSIVCKSVKVLIIDIRKDSELCRATVT